MEKLYPEYCEELKQVFMAQEMCFGNIFILNWHYFQEYCAWLFSLLDEIEAEIQTKKDEVPREYGYLSEWMLNVWVLHNKLKAAYVPIIFTEEKHDLKFFLKLAKETLGL